jgi:hypothetical protein
MSNIEDYVSHIENQIKEIIIKNSPDDSINLISQINVPNKNKVIGFDKALRLYKIYSNNSIKYNSKKYKNSYKNYTNDINSNINSAVKASKTYKKNK